MVAKAIIVETTDDKYIGIEIEIAEGFIALPDSIFHIDKVQILGSGVVRYSNTNYTITSKEE